MCGRLPPMANRVVEGVLAIKTMRESTIVELVANQLMALQDSDCKTKFHKFDVLVLVRFFSTQPIIRFSSLICRFSIVSD